MGFAEEWLCDVVNMKVVVIFPRKSGHNKELVLA